MTKHAAQEALVLKKKLEGLDTTRLKARHITKIVDICPTEIESLKTLLTAESITINQEDLKKILECLK